MTRSAADIRPIDMPQLRADVSRWLQGSIAERLWEIFANSDSFLTSMVGVKRLSQRGKGRQLLDLERRRWQMAETFYVTRDMCYFAQVAAETLPSFKIAHSDLPAEVGLLWLAEPMALTEEGRDGTRGVTTWVHAVSWGPFAGDAELRQPGVWLSLWVDAARAAEAHGRQSLAAWTPVVAYEHEAWIGYNIEFTPEEMHIAGTCPAIVRTVIAAWLLMGQEIPSVRRLQPRRSELKFARRRKLDLSHVRVVMLRHKHQEHGQRDAHARGYTHRWVVRGHWRNQWYPSQTRHIPIWINAHVKGPEAAPLLTGEVVNVLAR